MGAHHDPREWLLPLAVAATATGSRSSSLCLALGVPLQLSPCPPRPAPPYGPRNHPIPPTLVPKLLHALMLHSKAFPLIDAQMVH